jgi:hypothetical protein
MAKMMTIQRPCYFFKEGLKEWGCVWEVGDLHFKNIENIQLFWNKWIVWAVKEALDMCVALQLETLNGKK